MENKSGWKLAGNEECVLSLGAGWPFVCALGFNIEKCECLFIGSEVGRVPWDAQRGHRDSFDVGTKWWSVCFSALYCTVATDKYCSLVYNGSIAWTFSTEPNDPVRLSGDNVTVGLDRR